MYQEIYSIPNSFWFFIKIFLLILVCTAFYFFIVAYSQSRSKVALFLSLFFTIFIGIFGLGTYRSLLNIYLLNFDLTYVLEGKVDQIIRMDWDNSRIARAYLKVENINFSYNRKENFFHPSYEPELNEDIYLYKNREVRINYITVDTTNYILKLEVKVDEKQQNKTSKYE